MSEDAAGGAPLVFLVAGEPSGDLLGARLMAALRAETGGRVRFAGVGGEHMTEAGLESLVPIDDLAVMGLVEVLPHLFTVLGHIRRTAAAARAARPAVVVTIDSPSFTLEVSGRLRGMGIPLVHYVAPSVWAWKPGRAKRIARGLDQLFTLLPFEPPYFERHGLETTFVGHPAIEAEPGDGAAFRARHGIPPGAPLLAVLPGSRRSEVRRLVPAFAGALDLLRRDHPGLRAVVPTVSTVADEVAATAARWPVPALVVRGPDERQAAFAAADAALAASGTVAVELAVARVPTVIAYRVSPFSALLARLVVKVPRVSIPNILLGREVQPELLQERCTAPDLAAAVGHLLDDPDARAAQVEACAEVVRRLTPEGGSPSRLAARRVMALVGAGAAAVKR